MDYFSPLPSPIIHIVMSFLPIEDIIRCERVCKVFHYQLSTDSQLWKELSDLLEVRCGNNNKANHRSMVLNYCNCWRLIFGMLEKPTESYYSMLIHGLPYHKNIHSDKLKQMVPKDVVNHIQKLVIGIDQPFPLNTLTTSSVINAFFCALGIDIFLPCYADQELQNKHRNQPLGMQQYPKGWIIRTILQYLGGKDMIMFGRKVELHQSWQLDVKLSYNVIPSLEPTSTPKRKATSQIPTPKLLPVTKRHKLLIQRC